VFTVLPIIFGNIEPAVVQPGPTPNSRIALSGLLTAFHERPSSIVTPKEQTDNNPMMRQDIIVLWCC
jgi:hypothetical protein